MIKAGACVQCPGCKEPLYRVVMDIREGEIVRSAQFKQLRAKGADPRDGERADCPHCARSWFIHGQIHLHGIGWTA